MILKENISPLPPFTGTVCAFGAAVLLDIYSLSRTAQTDCTIKISLNFSLALVISLDQVSVSERMMELL